MVFRLIGAAVVQEDAAGFGVPVFRSLDEQLLVQKVGDDGRILEFVPLADTLEHQIGAPEINEFHNVNVGHPAIYFFQHPPFTRLFAVRDEMEDRLHSILEDDALLGSPVAQLVALRFMGCSYADEMKALNSVAELIVNRELREKFLNVEALIMKDRSGGGLIDSLIAELGRSGSFSDTHSIVAKLWVVRAQMSRVQCKVAMRAALNNSQVHWISEDEDIRQFLDFLISHGDIKLSASALEKISN